MPHLIISRGSQFSKIVSFDNNITIGRDQQNDIILESAEVSRIHASIEQQCGSYVLIDQNSTNGITIGEKAISRYELSPGVTFGIVDYLLTFTTDPDQQLAALNLKDAFLQMEPSSETMEKTVWIKPDADKNRMGRQQRFSEILRLVSSIATKTYDQEVGQHVLETLVKITGAKRGLIAFKTNSDLLVYAHSRGFDGNAIDQEVPRTILDQALLEGAPIFTHSVVDEEPSQNTVTVMLNSIICVPLSTEDIVFGCIYVDHPESQIVFTEEDRDLIFASAAYLSPALNTEVKSKQHLNREDEQLSKKLAQNEIIAHSPKTLELFKAAESVARYNVSVLIYGETGTGKEVVAQYLHRQSGRKGSFIARNCGAIAPFVFESELFGHEKGAFTGAVARKLGIFEIARQGTVFLDEIGDMPADMQVKLLRALQEKEIWRVGGTAPIKIDVRVLAATHRNIKHDRRQINFRDDLYYRLANVEITTPPLRERIEDIAPLSEYIIRKISSENEIEKRPTISIKVLRILEAYDWPGNIRELSNILLQLYMKTDGHRIEPHHLKDLIDVYDQPANNDQMALPSLEEVERNHILKALRQTGWNKSATARILKVDRNRLSRRLVKLNIDMPA